MSIEMGFEPSDFTARTWRAVAAEFIATTLFVFLGAGSVVTAIAVVGNSVDPSFLIAVALAHGLAIALLVSATARISGGHINPAVTFAAAITGKIKVSTALLYVAAQLIGAVLGAIFLKMVIAGPYEAGLGSHALNGTLLAKHSIIAGLMVESILTFVLVFVVFATAMDPKGMSNLAPIAIGMAVLVDHFVGIPLTGASMNPARTFGPALVANHWDHHYVYWIGPLFGGAVAALVYEYVFLVREDEEALIAPSPPHTDEPPAASGVAAP